MGLNGVTSAVSNYANTTNSSSKTKSSEKSTTTSKSDVKKSDDSAAVVYEKGTDSAKEETSTKKIYKQDTNIVNQLKADAERRSQQLQSLVQQMMKKQGIAYTNATDMFSLLREGKLNVDSATAAQAKKDIAEDGYWGVEQTSERFLSFAKALTGGDPSKADKMMKAVQKGFEQATKAWGGKLPDICQQTIDKTMEKFESWKNSIEE